MNEDELEKERSDTATTAPEEPQMEGVQANGDGDDSQETATPTTEKTAEPKTAVPAKAAQPNTVKLVSLNDIVSAVREAVWKVFDNINKGLPDDERQWVGSVRVYDAFGVVTVGMRHWRFAYTFADGMAQLPPKAEWEEVEPEWVTKTWEDATVVYPGSTLKAIGENDDGWIGGFLVRFTDENHPDLVGDFFDATTDFGPHDQTVVFYNHALDPVLGHKSLGVKSNGRAMMGTLKFTDVGVWLQAQLDMRDEYERAIYQMTKAGKMGLSSGTASHLVKRTLISGKAYHVDSWLLGIDASITPTPAAGPSDTAVAPLKAYQQRVAGTSLKLLIDGLPDGARKEYTPPGVLEEIDMTPEELSEFMKNAVNEAVMPLVEKVDANGAAIADMKKAAPTNRLPQDDGRDEGGGAETTDAIFAKSFFVQQFGEPDAAMKAVMGDVIGKDYEAKMWEITKTFRKWVLGGERRLKAAEFDLISRQYFAPSDLKRFMESGLSVAEIKARIERSEGLLQGIPLPPTMQERFVKRMGGATKDTIVSTSGQLGGYAISPMREDIVSRLPGATVVRASGARVVDLINATSVDIPVYSGGDDRYRGAIRGSWGGEKAEAGETNATMEMVSVQAHPYTFKVPMTRTMLMNAGNVVDLLTSDIVDTAAIDEDEAFLRGEGTGGKPLGIIPGGAYNANLVAGRATGAAITADLLIELSEALADQYMDGAIFALRRSTVTAIRQLKETAPGNYLLQTGIAGGAPATLLGHPYRRIEAMPAAASGAVPVLFGNFAGYLIVQEPGLTVERFQDSGTGLGMVEFHVWRMLGGRVERPWMFAGFDQS